MTTLTLLLLLAGADPCTQDTSAWKVIRHGPEEIRYSRDGNTTTVAVRNLGKQPVQVDVIWREVGLSGTVRVFDLAANRDEGKVQGGFAKKLAPGACAAYRLEGAGSDR